MSYIGCFNVTLYAYFDIHRIFDLILFRIWDFVLWWFDLDFVLFDYNFDFVLCLSFLFIFVMHFFMKVLFTFLTNFVIMNRYHKLWNTVIIIYLCVLAYITFTFVGIVTILLYSIEVFLGVLGLFLQDFQSFSDYNHIMGGSHNITMQTTYFFVLFYFVIVSLISSWIILLRYFYTQSYQIMGTVDTHFTNKSIDIIQVNMLKLYVIEAPMVENKENTNLYGYLLSLHVNLLVANQLLHIFHAYKTYAFNYNSAWFGVTTIKKATNLFNLTVCYVLVLHRNPFSDLTWMLLIPYVIFTINFFGSFVKDYTYINVVYNPVTLLFQFTTGISGFGISNYKAFKKQLLYMVI